MQGLSARFFSSAIVYGILGMVLGSVMGASGDHSQFPTHAHVILIGWVSFAIFAFFYHQFPEQAATLLAQAHFWLAQASYIVFMIGLYLIFSGSIGVGEFLTAVGFLAYLLSMVLFGVVALPVVSGGR